MKRLLLLLCVLLLSACGAQEEVVPQDTTSSAMPAVMGSDVEEMIVVEEGEAFPDEEPEEIREIETDTARRLAQEQAERIIETIEHPPKLEVRDRTTIAEEMYEIYKGLDSYKFKTPKGTYLVRGEKIRFLPLDKIRKTQVTHGSKYYREIYVDEVIFDREEKTATGYCTGFSAEVSKQCLLYDLEDIPFKLDYSEFMIKLPDQWVEKYLNIAPVNEEYEKYYVESIEATRVEFQDGVDMFFFPKAGLPIKIIVSPLEQYKFDNLVINQVRPEDVIHRSKDQIPPEESFYQPIY